MSTVAPTTEERIQQLYSCLHDSEHLTLSEEELAKLGINIEGPFAWDERAQVIARIRDAERIFSRPTLGE